MGWINLEEESDPVCEDFIALPFFVLFFPTIRFILDRFVFEKVARRLIYGKGHNKMLDVEVKERRQKLNKFKESAWKCVYFLSAEIFALSVTYNEPWFTNTKYFWVGPGDQVWPDQKIKLKLKGLYMYAAGFYTYSIFALIFWETRRKDFGVSMAHHVASVILLVLSYILSFARVGSVVLALHDASDVFLEVGKMSKYSKWEKLASFSFILFALAWIILRLICYPIWILRSTRVEEHGKSMIPFLWWLIYNGRWLTLSHVARHDSSHIATIFFNYEILLTLDKEANKPNASLYYYVFNVLLYWLLVVHIYWWILIQRMLIKQIQARGVVSEDIRSDSEGEDEHED